MVVAGEDVAVSATKTSRAQRAAGYVEHDDEALPEFDWTKPMIVSAWGRKGSGKSVFNRNLYDSWPGDKLCIDVNGNADPGPDARPVDRGGDGELPKRFPDPPAQLPGSPRPGPQNLHLRADPGSATYTEDLDRGIGMALFPQDHRTLVWAGEVGEFMPTANATLPSMRRLLMQNRHYRTTALFDGPRPVNVNPLVLAQSDFVAIYRLPNPADKKRVADSIGYPPALFEEACNACWRTEHAYLLWDARAARLYDMPPLPLDGATAARGKA